MQYSEKVLTILPIRAMLARLRTQTVSARSATQKCGDIMKIYLKVSDDGIMRTLSSRPSAAARQSQPARWLPRW